MTMQNGRGIGQRSQTLISAGMVVRRHGISYQTLNYYTSLGLLSVAARQGNQRFYRDRQVRDSLALIRRLQGEGYPLGLIRRVLETRGGASRAWRRMR